MIVRVCYLDYTEDGNEAVVRVVGRSEDGESVPLHVHGCEPYGYYPEEEPTPEMDCIVSEEYGYESYDGKPLKKISTQLPKHTNKVKDEFSWSGEADLPFYRRQSLDGLSGYIEVPDNKRSVNIGDINTQPEYDGEITPRVMIGDIEVLPDMDKTVEESVEQAEEPVVAITLWDSYEDEYCAIVLDEDRQVDAGEVRRHMEDHWDDSDDDYSEYGQADVTLKRCNSEEALLNEFVRYVEKCRPEIFSGWNCLPGDTNVLMGDGRQKPISEVGVGDEIIGEEEESTKGGEVINKWESKKEIRKINLADGSTIETSPDHRLKVGDDDNVDWKEAGDIEEGDYILKPRKIELDETEVPRLRHLVPDDKKIMNPEGFLAFRGNKKNIDREIKPKEMYYAGLIMSDGTLDKNSSKMQFYNGKKVLHAQFPGDNNLMEDNKGYYAQNVLDVSLMHAFNGLGIPFGRKNGNEIDFTPIFKMPEEYIARFVAGLMDGDGSVNISEEGVASITIASSNPSATESYKKLLKRLGITSIKNPVVTSIQTTDTNIRRLQEKVLGHMNHPKKVKNLEEISGGYSHQTENIPFSMFEAEVGTDAKRIGRDKWRNGYNIKRHHTNLEGWEDYVFVRVEGVRGGGREQCYDIETTTRNFHAENVLVHNCVEYDWTYLLNRIRKFDDVNQHDLSDVGTTSQPGWNTERAVDGVPAFDMMSNFCGTLSRHDWRSTALDYVANEKFGKGKVEDADVHTDYKRHRSRLLAYNIVDVQLTVKLDRDNDIHDYFFTLADISSVMIYDVAQ